MKYGMWLAAGMAVIWVLHSVLHPHTRQAVEYGKAVRWALMGFAGCYMLDGLGMVAALAITIGTAVAGV